MLTLLLTYLGWSFGGVLAFEVSRQLRKLGTAVQGVILIDSPYPIGHQALPPEVISHAVRGKPSKSKSRSQGRELASEAAKQARDSIEAQFQRHARMLQNYRPERDAGRDVPCVMLKCTQVIDTAGLCGVPYPWLSDETFRDQCVADWQQFLARQVPVLDVDCDHFEIFNDEHVSRTAFLSALQSFDGSKMTTNS